MARGIVSAFHFPSLKSRGLGTQWAILLALLAVLVFVLERLHLPAALMLGPMVAGILVAAAHGMVRVPGTAFILAQGVIGCMVARVIRPSLIGDVVADWPLFLVASCR